MDQVVPLVGTWIEILYRNIYKQWNESCPSWARGLKYHLKALAGHSESCPSWARGLKYHLKALAGHSESCPSWARGLKSDIDIDERKKKKSCPSWARGLKSIDGIV